MASFTKNFFLSAMSEQSRNQPHRDPTPTPGPCSAAMQVAVEFVGVPRVRAGVARCWVERGTLLQVLERVRQQFPALEDLLTESRSLAPWYRVVVDRKFVADLQTPIEMGQTVLILSADVGG
jgi:molybdopterin converting factor small subunit